MDPSGTVHGTARERATSRHDAGFATWPSVVRPAVGLASLALLAAGLWNALGSAVPFPPLLSTAGALLLVAGAAVLLRSVPGALAITLAVEWSVVLGIVLGPLWGAGTDLGASAGAWSLLVAGIVVWAGLLVPPALLVALRARWELLAAQALAVATIVFVGFQDVHRLGSSPTSPIPPGEVAVAASLRMVPSWHAPALAAAYLVLAATLAWIVWRRPERLDERCAV